MRTCSASHKHAVSVDENEIQAWVVGMGARVGVGVEVGSGFTRACGIGRAGCTCASTSGV